MYSFVKPHISNSQERKASDPLKDNTTRTPSTVSLATVLYYLTLSSCVLLCYGEGTYLYMGLEMASVLNLQVHSGNVDVHDFCMLMHV